MTAFIKWSQEIRWKAGLHLLVGWEGNGLREPMALVEEMAPAGLVFFSRNYPPGGAAELTDQLGKLQRRSMAVSGRPLLLALDNEGGLVKRLPPPHIQLPGAPTLAARGVGLIRAMASDSAAELKALGFNLNLAPVLDLALPGGFMETRSFGEDPDAVADLAMAFVNGFNDHGIHCCGKHFPGLGAAQADPHKILPTVDLDAEAMGPHLAPFAKAIDRGLRFVMTSHCAYPGLGLTKISTFSPKLCDILRERLGFKGLCLSDDLEMGAVANDSRLGEAAVSAVTAGHDLVLVCRKRDYIEETHRALSLATIDGHLKDGRFSESQRRLESFFERLKNGL